MLSRCLCRALLAMPLLAQGSELKFGPIPYPNVDNYTWVLIEIWPEVRDITLSAYFIDATSRKNQNLCEATKRALDRDAAALAKQQNREATSHRQCLTLGDAIRSGYVAPADR